MGENRFWITVWAVIGTVLVLLVSLGVYAGHLNDQRDLEMAKKGFHKYKVERCSNVMIENEWHEAGWIDKK